MKIFEGGHIVKKKKAGFWRHALFLGPASAAFLIAVLIPFIISMGYAFTDWNGVANKANFVGLKNFIDIFTGKSRFLDSFWFTLKISVVNVILINIVGTLFAVALTSKVKGRGAFRVMFYLPQTIGGLILGFVWQFIFVNGFPAIAETFHIGILNQQWLGTESTAFAALVIVSVWQNTGYVMVIMIAALSGIPSEMVESAKMDGANAVTVFFKVKLPLCISYITVSLFWTIANAFKMFDLNFSLTKGGPYGSTNSLALGIYNDAFSNNKYGLATAESMVFFVIIMVITGVQLYFTNKKERELL